MHGLGNDLTPGEFAIAVHRKHPSLIRVCHERTHFRKIKNDQEFQSTDGRRLALKMAQAKCPDLEAALAPWFDSKDRGRVCEIYCYGEGGEIRFQLTHGRIYRTDGSYDKRLKRSRVAYRPQKHDSVIYDTKTGVLKINAQTVGEKEEYRKVFGDILFGDPDYFPEGDLYTLVPLRRGKDWVRLANGVREVRLTEVWIQLDDDLGLVQISKGYDLIQSIEKHGKPQLNEGTIVRASFLIKYASGGRARKLEVRPSNVAIYDRDRDGTPARGLHAEERLPEGVTNGACKPRSLLGAAGDELPARRPPPAPQTSSRQGPGPSS